MWSNLMMAVASSLVPGFGFLGCIVDYVASDDAESGKRFLVELATTLLPSNFLIDLGASIATEVFFGSQISDAAREIVPHNEHALRCSRCGNITNYYVRGDGRLLCSNCIAVEVGRKVNYADKVHILRRGVYLVHAELDSRILTSRRLRGNPLGGRTLTGREL
jgi:hypothetical protein